MTEFGDQIYRELRKSHKMRNAARIFYYQEIMDTQIQATTSYERFIESWAGAEWLKKNQCKIADLRDANNGRFGWNGIWT